ncbi:MAG: PAS domain S-box protein [Chloroflexi bacterium]|nr:PAS domain S-box protein [Chloroflexota bacterium]
MLGQAADSGQTPWQELVTHDGLFVVDLRQRILYWSASAQHILGYRAEDVVGKPCYQVLGGRDVQDHRVCRRNCPVMANARRGRPAPDYDILCASATGSERWLNISVVIPKAGREPRHVLHLFRDVTNRRRTEEFARRASVAVRRLLSEGNSYLADGAEPRPTPLPKLSRREMEVLRLLAAGMSTRQIAETLAVRPVTARNHITRLLTKLGVENRLQAVLYASERHLI